MYKSILLNLFNRLYFSIAWYIEDHRVVLMRWNKNQKNTKKCSGRDLNPGSATRKAAMLDRIVQPYPEKTATTPPEHSQTV